MTRMLSLIIMTSLTLGGWCMAPPHPDFVEEFRERKRRRLLSNNKPVPPLLKLNPELCHGLSEETCLKMDENFARYTANNRELLSSAVGPVKTLALLVRFTDHVDRLLPSRENVSALWNAAEGEYLDIIPTGSISNFLRNNSYGKMQLTADVTDWITTDNTELYYSYGQSGLVPQLENAIYAVLRQMDASGFDFSQYDMNNDGELDSVVMLHSGYPAEISGLDCTNSRPDSQRIWSHAKASVQSQWISFDGRYTMNGYMVSSALRSTCGSSLARIGVMTHEFIHTWGLPDLYDTLGDWVGKGIGYYDIMSNPYGMDGAQTHPNNMSPWTKMQSGWLNPTEILQDGTYSIQPSALTDNVYIIRQGFPEKEYLLIENRQPMGWDKYLWNGGLLIWHIDDNADEQKNRGFPGQAGWPGNGRHYQVALAAADRMYHLEQGLNSGDEYDFWVSGQELSTGIFEYVATDYSQYPNTNSYMYGTIFPTGIRIFDISPTGSTMTFSVSGLNPSGTSPPTPAPTPPPTQYPSISPLSLALPFSQPSPLPTLSPPVVSPVGTTSSPLETISPVIGTSIAPASVAPATLGPATLPPVFKVPVTVAPVTVAPVTVAPITLVPVSLAPVTMVPVTVAPTIGPTAAPLVSPLAISVPTGGASEPPTTVPVEALPILSPSTPSSMAPNVLSTHWVAIWCLTSVACIAFQ